MIRTPENARQKKSLTSLKKTLPQIDRDFKRKTCFTRATLSMFILFHVSTGGNPQFPLYFS